MGEMDALRRAHQLFAATALSAMPETRTTAAEHGAPFPAAPGAGYAHDRYRQQLDRVAALTRATGQTDTALHDVIAGARRDHLAAQTLTRQVLDAARADTGPQPDSPVAQREAVRRRVARLRAQHGHVLAARRRAALRLALLRALRYRALRRAARSGRFPLMPPSNRAAAAVRAALSRLGRPYVWGATGPDRFDCSGLVQWSYHQAGVQLGRTTYDQIDDGFAVPRSQIQPGDLVFPHAGHVQMAIGNGMVVEAPHAGATVRVTPLGHDIAIRRPFP